MVKINASLTTNCCLRVHHCLYTGHRAGKWLGQCSVIPKPPVAPHCMYAHATVYYYINNTDLYLAIALCPGTASEPSEA